MPDLFEMRLEVPPGLGLVASVGECNYDDETDDVRSLLSDLCSRLAEEPQIAFRTSFAGEPWPTDVQTDLATVLEQLPNLPSAFVGTFDLDFYEQGLERTLHFVSRESEVEITATSKRPTWTPPNRAVRLSRDAVQAELRSLAERFAELSIATRPDLWQHPWFRDWRREVSTRLAPVRPHP